MKNQSKLKFFLSFALAAVLLATLSSQTKAQTLVDYNPADDMGLNGNSGNEAVSDHPFTPSNVSPLITATDFTRGPGTTGYDNAGGATDFFGAYYTSGSDATLSDAYTNGIYETFTLTAGATGADIRGLKLTNDFFFQDANTYIVEDTAHGFGTSTANQLEEIDFSGSRYAPGTTVTFATPVELLPGQSDTFRLYAYGLGSYTDFGIGDGGSGNDTKPFEVLGGVIPEPSTYALLGLGLAFLVMAVRNRRSSAV